jgi:hypothetical protein
MSTKTLALAALLLAAALPSPVRAHPPERPDRWGTWSVDLVDESGAVLPTFRQRGRTYVLGTLGQRYLVRVRNGSPVRTEVVVSVDGRDVIDGRPAAWEKRGYLVDPYGEVVIDGYRLSQQSVAAFRFSSVPRSYAARMGDARDVGVIGVAVFPERPPRYVPPPPFLKSPRDEGAGAPSARSEGAPPAPAEARAEPPGSSAEAKVSRAPSPQRPGLGTEFGEQHESRVTQVSFERARPRPDAVLTVRYDDRPGLLALGIDLDGRDAWSRDDAWLRQSADPFRRSSYSEPPPGWRP